MDFHTIRVSFDKELTEQVIPRSDVKPGESFRLGNRALIALARNASAHVRWPHCEPRSFGFGVLRGDVEVTVYREAPQLTFADLEPGERFRIPMREGYNPDIVRRKLIGPSGHQLVWNESTRAGVVYELKGDTEVERVDAPYTRCDVGSRFGSEHLR